ncbi:flagellar motor protein [Marinomonas agarivorans]|nr:flagellar motor protein [Marinomonas agarivorans]
MAEKSDTPIRRVRKIKKAAPHGGAWKIALADFALAMMAFFMVLWIMSVASPEELAAIEGYFNDPKGIGTAGHSNNPIDLGGSPAKSNQHKLDLLLPDPGSVKTPEKTDLNEEASATKEKAELVETISNMMQEVEVLKSVESNIKIDITPDGVRITLLDNENKPMFSKGSGQLTPEFEAVLLNVGQVISQLKNQIVIAGHTDSSTYSTGPIGNWELSAMRANEARRLLEEGGVRDANMAQVVGLADSVPYDKEDPTGATNRRVSLILLTDEGYRAMVERNRRSYSEVEVEQKNQPLKAEDVF